MTTQQSTRRWRYAAALVAIGMVAVGCGKDERDRQTDDVSRALICADFPNDPICQ